MASEAAAAADPVPAPHVVDECRGVLFVYSDGTVVRRSSPGFSTPVHDDGSVEWKDATFDAVHGLGLRLYHPRDHHRGGEGRRKLPVFFYYHGGGFCIGSRTWPNVQNYCLRLAAELDALVVAPDYRLAPEHRLPAALHDAAAALLWITTTTDPWLSPDAADLTRVFVSGDSAGGTIAHHLAVRFGSATGRADLTPATAAIRGYVQLMPFFGGVERTRSEIECPDNAFLNRDLNDRYWRLSLPEGATADHPVSNPFGAGAPALEEVEFAPTMVVVGGCDILHDRAVDYAARLKAMGKPVEVRDFEGQQHGFFTIDPWCDAADELMRVIKRFVDSDGRFD